MSSLPGGVAAPEWLQPRIDGEALLNDVHGFYRRFVAFPSEHAAVACTLWAGAGNPLFDG